MAMSPTGDLPRVSSSSGDGSVDFSLKVCHDCGTWVCPEVCRCGGRLTSPPRYALPPIESPKLQPSKRLRHAPPASSSGSSFCQLSGCSSSSSSVLLTATSPSSFLATEDEDGFFDYYHAVDNFFACSSTVETSPPGSPKPQSVKPPRMIDSSTQTDAAAPLFLFPRCFARTCKLHQHRDLSTSPAQEPVVNRSEMDVVSLSPSSSSGKQKQRPSRFKRLGRGVLQLMHVRRGVERDHRDR